MSVDLTGIRIQSATLSPVMFGRQTRSDQGGTIDYDDRLGNRWSMQVTTPPMRYEPEGRLLIGDLWEAVRVGGIFRVVQPEFVPLAYGEPVVASNTLTGRSIPLTGLTPNVAIKRGQWVTFIHAGRRYFDQVRAQVIADASGQATISTRFLLRESLAAGDQVLLAAPEIEGFVDGDLPLNLPVDCVTSFTFTVTEAR